MADDGQTYFGEFTTAFDAGFQAACEEMIFVLSSKDINQELETRLTFMTSENAEIFKKLFHKI